MKMLSDMGVAPSSVMCENALRSWCSEPEAEEAAISLFRFARSPFFHSHFFSGVYANFYYHNHSTHASADNIVR